MTRTPRRRPRPTSGAARLTLAILLALAGGGCAFDRDWKRLAAAVPSDQAVGVGVGAAEAAVPDPLAGRWEGTWTSETTNHSGKLRAIVTPAGDDAYRARFDATYFGLMRFGYAMTLTATPPEDGGGGGGGDAGSVTRFTGEENLGWLAGGVYRYDGTTDGHTFDCAYESKHDRGRFQMTRPTR